MATNVPDPLPRRTSDPPVLLLHDRRDPPARGTPAVGDPGHPIPPGRRRTLQPRPGRPHRLADGLRPARLCGIRPFPTPEVIRALIESAPVSVVIPTRNRPRLLREAVASVQSQTVPPQEIVVVDDGSDPEALAVLDDLETEGVRVLRNGTSRGGSAARNRGWKSGTAPWVAFLDDDDTFEPTKLELQMETVRRSGGRWSWTDYRMVDRTHLDELDRIRPRNVTFVDVLARSPIPSSTLLIARDLLEAVGGFDESLPRNQDRDLILRLLLEAPGVPVEGEAPLTTMRWHMPDPASCLAGEEALHRKWADRTRALSPGERRRVESERHWNRWVNLARLPDRGAELRAVVAALGLRPWVGRYWRSLLIALLHAVGWRGRFAADEAKAGR